MLGTGFWRRTVLAVAAVGLATAQTRIDLRTQGRNVDFADAVATRPFAVGTALPANCTPGQAFFKSDAEAGRNLYLCTAAGVWRVTSGDPSVVTVAGLPPAGSHTGQMFIVSDAQNKGDCSLGGGAVYTACVSDGTTWSPLGGSRPPYVRQFDSPALTWMVDGATHGLGTEIEVFVQVGEGSSWRRADPAEVVIHRFTGDVTVQWATPTAGRILISSLTGTVVTQGGGGTMDHSQLLNLDYESSGHTGFARANHGEEHRHGGSDEIATESAQPYGIPKAGPLGLLSRTWLPLMQGDTGSGGLSGAVPAPGPGDASKCLRGDGTWGSCGAASGGYTTIQDEGAVLPGRPAINFTGLGVTCTDDAANNRTICSIPGGGGGGTFDAAGTYDLSGLNKVNMTYASIYLPNNTATGTALYRTVCLASDATAEQCGLDNAGRAIGICMEGCGQSGNARIAIQGFLTCEFDGGVTAGNWVTVSSSQPGKCSDAGTTKPSVALGIALVTQAGAGSYDLIRGIQ